MLFLIPFAPVRCFLLAGFCFFLYSALYAQQTDFDAVIQPVDVKARDFSEYLVQLAWLNHPESAAAQNAVKIEQGKAVNVRKEWMRDVQTSFNLNEGNLRPASADGNVFFPRYNFGLNLNLYNITSQKTKNTIARREIQQAGHKVNGQKLALRAETLQRYAKFKLAKELLKTRTLVEQEVYANYILIKQLYNTDEKTFEEYTLASSSYYEAQETRIHAQTDLELARLALEEIIGLRWDQVQHPAKEE